MTDADPFDPRTWPGDDGYEYRIYLDDTAQTYVIVDAVNYQWAVQWKWKKKKSRTGLTWYAVRTSSTSDNGVRNDVCLYLHVEIMKRTGIPPPSTSHTMTDHRNGKSYDDRRKNLRWATPSMNSRNQYGSHAYDLMEKDYAQSHASR